jgi:hypothetical protein
MSAARRSDYRGMVGESGAVGAGDPSCGAGLAIVGRIGRRLGGVLCHFRYPLTRTRGKCRVFGSRSLFLAKTDLLWPPSDVPLAKADIADL